MSEKQSDLEGWLARTRSFTWFGVAPLSACGAEAVTMATQGMGTCPPSYVRFHGEVTVERELESWSRGTDEVASHSDHGVGGNSAPLAWMGGDG